ncbi:MAG: 3-hydroxybutyryl-CoA dehydrogenase [Myxococcota bacterium]
MPGPHAGGADLRSEFKTIGVIGAGQMGGGIAQVAAQAGAQVVLVDMSVEHAERGKAKVAAGLAKLVERGKLSADGCEALLARIQPAGTLGDLARADYIVEASTEDQTLKQRLFRQVDEVARPGAILASNTSSISITLLGAATRRPDKVIGLHFMNPVPQMKLVEVIRGLATDDATFDATMGLARRLGKDPVTCRDIPGFIVNRILLPSINEGIYALYEGLGTAEDIDHAAKLGLNHPMGPLELADLIGLDTCLAILEVMHRELGEDKYRPCPLLRQYVAAGWLGRKTGRGFYRY